MRASISPLDALHHLTGVAMVLQKITFVLAAGCPPSLVQGSLNPLIIHGNLVGPPVEANSAFWQWLAHQPPSSEKRRRPKLTVHYPHFYEECGALSRWGDAQCMVGDYRSLTIQKFQNAHQHTYLYSPVRIAMVVWPSKGVDGWSWMHRWTCRPIRWRKPKHRTIISTRQGRQLCENNVSPSLS